VQYTVNEYVPFRRLIAFIYLVALSATDIGSVAFTHIMFICTSFTVKDGNETICLVYLKME